MESLWTFIFTNFVKFSVSESHTTDEGEFGVEEPTYIEVAMTAQKNPPSNLNIGLPIEDQQATRLTSEHSIHRNF